jgi:PadR family transcriptional regulator, regulatory protein PadR
MPASPRVTVAVAQVLREFLVDPAQPRYGFDLMRRTGFPSGKLYPILGRLERAGWILRSIEDIDPSAAGRPARSMYLLSEQGVEAARLELATLRSAISIPVAGALRPEPGGGQA